MSSSMRRLRTREDCAKVSAVVTLYLKSGDPLVRTSTSTIFDICIPHWSPNSTRSFKSESYNKNDQKWTTPKMKKWNIQTRDWALRCRRKTTTKGKKKRNEKKWIQKRWNEGKWIVTKSSNPVHFWHAEIALNYWMVFGNDVHCRYERFLTYENRKVDGTDGLDFDFATKKAFVAVDTLIISWLCPHSFMLHVFSEIAQSLPVIWKCCCSTSICIQLWSRRFDDDFKELFFAFLSIAIVAR